MFARTATPVFSTEAGSAVRVSHRGDKRSSWASEQSISTTRTFANTAVRVSTDSAVLQSSGSDGITHSSPTSRDRTTLGFRTPSRPLNTAAMRVGRHVFMHTGSVCDTTRTHAVSYTKSTSSRCPVPPYSARPTHSTNSTAPQTRASVGERRSSMRAIAPCAPLASRSIAHVVTWRGGLRQKRHVGQSHTPRPPASKVIVGVRDRLRARVTALRQSQPAPPVHNTATVSVPHEFLRFLGSAAVNDAPLTSFLPCTAIGCAPVHLLSVDGCRLRIDFADWGSLPAAFEAALAPLWARQDDEHSVTDDGAVTVVLTVLDDGVRALLRPAEPQLLDVPRKRTVARDSGRYQLRAPLDASVGWRQDVDSVGAYGVPMWDSHVTALHLPPPSAPVSNMSTVNQELDPHYATALNSDVLEGGTPAALYPARHATGCTSPLPPPLTNNGLATSSVDGGNRKDEGCDGSATPQLSLTTLSAAAPAPVVEGWRRYSSMAALYIALATVRACSLASLPFASVQLVSQKALLTEAVRIEMQMASIVTGAGGAASLALRRAKLAQLALALPDGEDWLPVAVELPLPRKGTLNGAALLGKPPSMQSAPFSDAELFQVLYLQLVFRKFYDVRFPHLIETNAQVEGADSAEPTCWWTRTDYIGIGDRAADGLAFEHPSDPTRCLYFPPFSRSLVLLGLEQAVLPMYATAETLQRTSRLPLAGSSPDVLCTGRTGQRAVRWAWTQDINSPRAATYALEGLFEQFEDTYGCSRRDLGRAGVSALLCYSSEEAIAGSLQQRFIDLSRFFVPPEMRFPDREADTDEDDAQALNDTRALFGATITNNSFTPVSVVHTAAEAADSARSDDAAAVDNASIFSVVNVPGTSAGATTTVTTTTTTTMTSAAAVIPFNLTPLACAPSPAPSLGDGDSLGGTVRAADVLPMSPFTKQESLVTRWRQYIQTGFVALFDGLTLGIELQGFIGKGGSGLVYKGVYGRRRLPVAVKVFIIPDGMSHEDYVRESLTDVSFYVLLNQLDDFGICNAGRAHDFIVSASPPKGFPEADAKMARRGADASSTRLCYLVTDLMDGTLGRFVREDEDDYDPCYDTLVNSPLRDVELFQFLFMQLVCKSLFDWRVLDLMLNGQLRGDNLGFRYPQVSDVNGTANGVGRGAYDGFFLAYQTSPEAEVRYLRFPMTLDKKDPAQVAHGPLRFIFLIDLGQGMQPNVEELAKNKFIGQTVVDSCVQDDGFGRYWPLDELYCRYVEVTGEHAQKVVEWGSHVRLHTQDDAVTALTELLELYAPVYGSDAPSSEERARYVQLNWSPSSVAELKKAYVYRAGV